MPIQRHQGIRSSFQYLPNAGRYTNLRLTAPDKPVLFRSVPFPKCMIACLASSRAFQVGNARQPPPSVRHHENRPSGHHRSLPILVPIPDVAQTKRREILSNEKSPCCFDFYPNQILKRENWQLNLAQLSPSNSRAIDDHIR
ncbi:hypothetical protein [Bradyrhizobium sp. AUGA SZCCT0182]|uniref:hypothetical protein n=1 Tax=Bradyrhizobium sp. AUGA SZCCT0182 TaxID=2807667 RepID=UPI001BA9233E|nr:hypothetical protein [Bradyrhizobium sp. AUGA SZCCT0182]MBR1234843.1 hypothetical protein [Bradyrhizobium sp. AUGA SZCCT0182]